MAKEDFSVLRTHHIVYRVTDLDRALAFYVDGVGFTLTDRDNSHAYLRGLEDRTHHNLVLVQNRQPGVEHVGFRVASEEDLDHLATHFDELGIPYHWVQAGQEKGLGRALRAQDPFSFPIEFFYAVDHVDWSLQAFDQYHGAQVMRIDHVNYVTPDVNLASKWYEEQLGFQLSEYTVSVQDGVDRLWGAWLHRKQTSHDVAIANGAGPRFHHASFIASSQQQILHVADRLAALNYVDSLERGPGRHGTTNAFFLYLRDPDGNRIELFTGDYLLADPDWEPIRWDLEDPKRATFWGAPAPARWFDEAMTAYDWTGQAIAVTKPNLPDRPRMVVD